MLRPTWIDDGSPIPDPFGYGERAVQWLRRRKHPANPAPGHPFVLDPWQERIIRRIYGPRHPDRTRIVKQVFLGLPRGNRKTSLSAALALLHLCGPEAVPGGHLVSAASKRDQAREAFKEACLIVALEKKWRGHIRVADHRNTIKYPKLQSYYESISADAGGAHGQTLSFALVDELHAHRTANLWEAVRGSADKTEHSLVVIATTAGAGSENVCYERWHYACAVQRGEVTDPTFLPVVFAMEEGDDWQDETLWRAVNPGLACGYPPIAAMRRHAKEGESIQRERVAFQRFRLNKWQESSEDPFIEMSIYDEGGDPIDIDQLVDAPCFIGVDLSSRLDLTAVVACWRTGSDGYVVHPFFFCPEANIEGRDIKDHEVPEPYKKWAEQKYITATPGNVVDYRFVQKTIFDLCDRFNVQKIGVDPWRAQSVLQWLIEKDLPAAEFRQNAASMVPAIAELQRAILGRRFFHGGNPVLRWNFANIRCVRDRNENILFHKSKSIDKIDGAVAAAMAVQLAFESELPGRAIDDAEFLRDFYKDQAA